MAHKYESIRELDDEMNGGKRETEMSIEKYMIPPPFWELGGSIKDEDEEEVRYEPYRPPRLANSSNRIRVKNICTGVRFEFKTMINSARFVGATNNALSMSIGDKRARVYCIDGEEYVFEYDGHDRPKSSDFISYPNSSMGNEVIEVVSSTGERTIHYSYLSVARQLGLLIRHVMEEEEREKKGEMAKNYILGKEMYTLEFGNREREKYFSRGIVCHWKGIYDKDGDWEKIRRIKVMYGNSNKKR